MSVPILMYHQIAPAPPIGTPYRGLSVCPRDFRRQMLWLKRLGYRGLSIRELMPYVKNQRQAKVVGITFDDGYRNVHQHALPVLQELGFSATNYFVANQIDGSNVWDRDKAIPPSATMSAAEIRQWACAGNEVGSHTLDHVDLKRTAFNEAQRQIVQAKLQLEDLLGSSVTAFCYPYGHEFPEHRIMVSDAGYENATVTQRGLASSLDNPFALPRISIARSTNLFQFFLKCLTSYEDRHRRTH